MSPSLSPLDIKFLELFAQTLLASNCFSQLILGYGGRNTFTLHLRATPTQVHAKVIEAEYRDNPLSQLVQKIMTTRAASSLTLKQGDVSFQMLGFPLPHYAEGGFVIFDSRDVAPEFPEDAVAFLRTKSYAVCSLKDPLIQSFDGYQRKVDQLKSEMMSMCFEFEQNERKNVSSLKDKLKETDELLEIIKRSRNKLYKLFDNISVGLCSVNRDNRIVSANRHFAVMAGKKEVKDVIDTPIGRYMNLGTQEDVTDISDCLIGQAFESHESVSTVLDAFQGKSGVYSVELFALGEQGVSDEVGIFVKDMSDLAATQRSFQDFQKFAKKKFETMGSLHKEYQSVVEKHKMLMGKYLQLTKDFESMSHKCSTLQVKYEQSAKLLAKDGMSKLLAEKVELQRKSREAVHLLTKQKTTVDNLMTERGMLLENTAEGYRKILYQMTTFTNKIDSLLSRSSGLNTRQLEDMQQMLQTTNGGIREVSDRLGPLLQMINTTRGLMADMSTNQNFVASEMAVENVDTIENLPALVPVEAESVPYVPSQAPADAGSSEGIQLFRLNT
ncbi:PAS domain-containing protein [Chrysiogenes arsenatis]|uniref:PAS domain-containing protein n=1 Tax=Chrysiogenes arsenatis TaxID=309797 RepID=UPI0003FFD646|nr:PAS domain-containing protein [Chrysiogenes arsenatis]